MTDLDKAVQLGNHNEYHEEELVKMANRLMIICTILMVIGAGLFTLLYCNSKAHYEKQEKALMDKLVNDCQAKCDSIKQSYCVGL